MERNFNQFMTEKKEINRWMVSVIFITGMFAGACLMFVFALAGMI